MNLVTLLNKYDDTLRNYNPSNYEKLQAPLSVEKIEEHLHNFGVDDENLKALFHWKNGFEGENSGDRIFKKGGLLSMEYILKLSSLSLSEDLWKDTFIPLVSEGGGDYLLFNKEKGPDYGKLHLYCVSLLYIDEPISYYDSIYSMIKTTIDAYEEKVLIFDELNGSRLKYDIDAFNSIAKKNNKHSDFWIRP